METGGSGNFDQILPLLFSAWHELVWDHLRRACQVGERGQHKMSQGGSMQGNKIRANSKLSQGRDLLLTSS
jgi:hypothetical protein